MYEWAGTNPEMPWLDDYVEDAIDGGVLVPVEGKTVWYCSANGVIEDGECPSHKVCPAGSRYALLVGIGGDE